MTRLGCAWRRRRTEHVPGRVARCVTSAGWSRGDLAAAQRRQVAGGAPGVRSLVEGGTTPHPLVAGGRVGTCLRPVARCGPAGAGGGLSRRHLDPGAPEGGGRKRGAAVHALGRSRGGYGTKACTVCDAQGRALGFALIPGQASELRAAPSLLLLVVLLGVVARVICDGAYSSATWRALVRQVGAEPVVRPNPTHRSAPEHDRDAYRRRSRVENLWARLKEWRALATRYDKTVQSFSGALHLAAALDWLSNGP